MMSQWTIRQHYKKADATFIISLQFQGDSTSLRSRILFFFTQVSSWKVTCVQLFALAGNEGLHLRENQLNAEQGVAVSLHFISMKISIEYRSRLQLRYTVELENHAYE